MASESGVLYTKDYQYKLLSHLALDATLLQNALPLIRLTDFEIPACQLVFECLKDYYTRFNKLPTFDYLLMHVDQMMKANKTTVRLTPEENESLVVVFDIIARYTVPGTLNPEYFDAQLTDYIKTVRTSQVVDAHMTGLQMGQNPDKFIAQILKVENEVTRNTGMVLDNMYENPEPVSTAEQIQRISTGLHPLNYRIGGGLGVGEFGMITACPGVGKTTAQLNFMDGANVAGWRSLFLTLEMSGKRIKHRHQSITAGIPAHMFKIPITDWNDDMLQRWAAVMDPSYRCYGYAAIMDLSKEGHTINDMDKAIEMWKESEYKRGHDVNACRAVFIDWLDMLEINGMALSKDTKEHELLKKACYKLGQLARKHGVALWTATQGTRDADGREMLSMKHVSGAYHKNDALDVSLGIGVVYDATNVQRTADNAQDDDASITDTKAAVPCSRKLMLNLMKNRDNSPCAVEVYQGPTLKLWNKEQDAVAADRLLNAGNFTKHMENLRKVSRR